MTAPPGLTGDPSLDKIRQEFEKRSTDAAKFSDPLWLSEFSIHHRQIQQYKEGHVFFAGDAAHIHSPMGGQGLNTGLQDIYNLAWKLALVEKGKALPSLLETYHEERFPVGADVLKKTDRMTRMILIKNPLLVAIRNTMVKFISSIGKVRKSIVTDLAELAVAYSKSTIVQSNNRIKGLEAGSYLPSFDLKDNNGQVISSRQAAQGTLHHLFIFAGTKPKKLTSILTQAEQIASNYQDTLQVHLISSQAINSLPKTINLLIDANNQAHSLFGLKKSSALLVRPDKYIARVQRPFNGKKLLSQFYLLP